MGFHITQPGSSVATSLIEGESKPKHVLLLEIKVICGLPLLTYFLILIWRIGFPLFRGTLSNCVCQSQLQGNQYRPTKIPLNSVRPFEYTEVVSSFADPILKEPPFFSFIYLFLFMYLSLAQVVLKDEPDIDPNDQNSILEHLDKVVS